MHGQAAALLRASPLLPRRLRPSHCLTRAPAHGSSLPHLHVDAQRQCQLEAPRVARQAHEVVPTRQQRAYVGRAFGPRVAAGHVALSQLRQDGHTHWQPPEECRDRTYGDPGAFLRAPSLLGRTHSPLVVERQR
eukprot:2685154-Prymnesium_polylepis.1